MIIIRKETSESTHIDETVVVVAYSGVVAARFQKTWGKEPGVTWGRHSKDQDPGGIWTLGLLNCKIHILLVLL
jgi:hypothetical protein